MRLILALLAAFLTWAGPQHLSAQEASFFVRNERSGTVIIFVHGVLGNGSDTWKSGPKSWPEMLAGDDTFSGADIFVVNYPTSLWNSMSIDELGENLRLQLDAFSVSSRQNLIFVAHSMGGLVTRSFLLKNPERLSQTRFAYFLSTPTHGSHVARLANLLSSNPQLTRMRAPNADDYLADQQRAWLNLKVQIPSYCAYEKRLTYRLEIVTFTSGSVLCNKRLDPIDADHISIAKPAAVTDAPYLALKSAFLEQMKSRTDLPNSDMRRQFREILVAINFSLNSRSDILFPALEQFKSDPSPNAWQLVRTIAAQRLYEVESGVKKVMEFHSQFFEQGNKVLVVVGSGIDVVDRRYMNIFRGAQQQWISQRSPNKAIIDQVAMPTIAEADAWLKEYKEIHYRLSQELEKLIRELQPGG